jgi:hypothetical protein
MSPFIKGKQLSKDFYLECVLPLLEKYFPDLQYSAARIGVGSDVLGFDDQQSRDHDWGPRVDLFFSAEDYGSVGDKVYEVLSYKLPFKFKGYSTHFVDDYLMGDNDQYPIIHRARTYDIDQYFIFNLGFNPANEITELDWLRTPELVIRMIMDGEIFHDGLPALQESIDKLEWYPDDIWYYIMACQWMRIDQEEPFVARTGDVGDELGSRVITARQVKEIMHLCFQMEREYAPYHKWFGTAFSRLKCAQKLQPLLESVFLQENWQDREKILSEIYLILGEMHNDLSITEYIEPKISHFHDRPYLVPHSARFYEALMDKVQSPRLRAMKRGIGAVHQFTDSTDISCWTETWEEISSVYNLTQAE